MGGAPAPAAATPSTLQSEKLPIIDVPPPPPPPPPPLPAVKPVPPAVKPAPGASDPQIKLATPQQKKTTHTTTIRKSTPQAQPARSKKMWIVGAGVLAVLAGAAIPLLQQEPALGDIERPAVANIMERFRAAYRNRDMEGVLAVFPTLPRDLRQTMQKSFSECLVYEVTFADMRVAWSESTPTRAEVDVRSDHTCTPNSDRRQTTTGHHDLFTLKKDGENWVIDSMAPVAEASAGRPQ
jgi:hypothetical protein